MTAPRRRLRVLEESLSATEAVLCWLTEARAFGGFAEYAAATLETPERAAPLERISARVEAAVRRERRGASRATLAAAIAGPLEDALFRYELVLRLNAEFLELRERLAPRLRTLLAGCDGRTAGVAAPDPPDAPLRKRGVPIDARARVWREQLDELLAIVAAEEEARALLERHYFDGVDTLFADVAGAWRTLSGEVRNVSASEPPAKPMGASGTARRARGMADPLRATRAARTRADAIAADARLAALLVLGEQARATALIRGRVGNGNGIDPRLAVHALERLSWPLTGRAVDERSESSMSTVAKRGTITETAYKARLEAVGKLMALVGLDVRGIELTGRDGAPINPEADHPLAHIDPAQQAADLRIMAEEISRRAAAPAQE
jgi:hypothetical protein